MWPQGNGRPVRATRAEMQVIKRCVRIVFIVTQIEHRSGRRWTDDQAKELYDDMVKLPIEQLDANIAELKETLAATPPRHPGAGLPLSFDFAD